MRLCEVGRSLVCRSFQAVPARMLQVRDAWTFHPILVNFLISSTSKAYKYIAPHIYLDVPDKSSRRWEVLRFCTAGFGANGASHVVAASLGLKACRSSETTSTAMTTYCCCLS